MARSMTGFGRATVETGNMTVSVELKSVNHRYFELYSRVPRTYGFLDEKIKTYLQGRVSRGKIECSVSIEALDSDDVVVKVNHSLAKAYLSALDEISDTYELKKDIAATTLTRFPDVLSVHKNDADEEAVWEAVLPALSKACDNFIEMREREGEKLKLDILSKADSILSKVAFIEERSPQTVLEYNERLKTKISDLLKDAKVDEQIHLTGADSFEDKVAFDE